MEWVIDFIPFYLSNNENMFHVEQIILRRKFLKLHKIKKPELSPAF